MNPDLFCLLYSSDRFETYKLKHDPKGKGISSNGAATVL
jgi:aspartate 1-decarboxylase